MKDAVFTSKCCYRSFCDKCIRDCIISKSMCYCKAENILADDLLPNTTVRDTINRILESGNSSTITDNGGSFVHVEDMESAPCLPPKLPSPTQSDVSNVDQSTPSKVEELNVKESVEVTKDTLVSTRAKEHVLQNDAFAVEEAQKKPPAGHARSDMDVEPGVDEHMGPSNFKPYSQGRQRPQDDYMGRFSGNMHCNMSYHLVPQNFGYPPLIPSHPPWSQRDVAANFSDHCHRERERSRERDSVERDQDSNQERRHKSIHHRQSDRDHGHYHCRIKC
ncbi:E3 ubiquitin ligase PQT3-like [Silene latifolia]|uniref:E3 ubiquitin ligase PQT3-like n=1 Tax=Silene latifolia TaxID=37657 RepID=UPI003D7853EF